MTITLTSKNQITIPKKLVNELHLKEGALFNVRVNQNRLELTPMEMVEKTFTDAEYAKMEKIFQNEKHLTRKVTAKLIESL